MPEISLTIIGAQLGKIDIHKQKVTPGKRFQEHQNASANRRLFLRAL